MSNLFAPDPGKCKECGAELVADDPPKAAEARPYREPIFFGTYCCAGPARHSWVWMPEEDGRQSWRFVKLVYAGSRAEKQATKG